MPLAALVAATSIVAGLWPFGPRAHDLTGRVEAWRLVVRRDAFSGQPVCVLRTGDAYVERGVVMFKLPARENVSDAQFRIDGGPARSVRDNDVDVVKAGLPVYQDGKDPRAPALAPVPASRLQGATSVAFQLRPGGRVYRFDLRGFDSAFAAATASGCQPTTFREALK